MCLLWSLGDALEAEAFREAHCEETMLCGSAERANGKGAEALGATKVPFGFLMAPTERSASCCAYSGVLAATTDAYGTNLHRIIKTIGRLGKAAVVNHGCHLWRHLPAAAHTPGALLPPHMHTGEVYKMQDGEEKLPFYSHFMLCHLLQDSEVLLPSPFLLASPQDSNEPDTVATLLPRSVVDDSNSTQPL